MFKVVVKAMNKYPPICYVSRSVVVVVSEPGCSGCLRST